MKTKKHKLISITTIIFIVLIGLVFTVNCQAVDISFQNPVGSEQQTMADFLENVMAHLRSVIAYLAVLFIVLGGIMYILSGSGGGNETLKKAAQNTLIFSIIGLALAITGPSFLREIKIIILGNSGGQMPVSLDQAPTLKMIVINTLKFLLSIIGILAIITLTIGGMTYITSSLSGKNEEQISRAHKMIFYSLIGIAVSGASLMIVKKIAELLQ